MGRRDFHEITFEKGLYEAEESSMVPHAFATQLKNWEPQPQGNLRARSGWKNTSTTGAPATRIARGIGFLAKQSLFRVPGFVQSNSAAASAQAINVAWPAATTAGNHLVLVVGTATAPAITATGWTLAVQEDDTQTQAAIYYKPNASSESGNVTVSIGGGVNRDIRVWIGEYSGVLGASPLDVTASKNDADTSGSVGDINTGTTATTAQTVELVIGCAFEETGGTYSGQSGGHVERLDSNGLAVWSKTTTVVAGQTVTATSSATGSDYVGAIATFKAAPSLTDTTGGDYLVADRTSTTGYTIYEIGRDSLVGGTYASADTITVSTTRPPIAFAAGLGGILYTNQYFSTLRRWESVGGAAALTGTPPGRCIAFHKSRFFVAGTGDLPSRLWFSELGDHTKFWQEDFGQTDLDDSTNWIDVEEDDGEPIEDIKVSSDALVVAKRTSLHVLTGDSTDTFRVDKLNGGGGYPGRCICDTPFGAVIAGEDAVFLWSGGGAEVISKPIESSYGLTGNFCSTAYVDGKVSICDSGTGTVYTFNIITGSWSIDEVNSATEEPAFVFGRLNKLLMGPMAATTGSLLSFRDFPQTRTRDANTSTVFTVATPEMVLVGPQQEVTPRYLHLQLRQLGGDETQTGLTITPYYDGTATDAITIPPRERRGVSGV